MNNWRQNYFVIALTCDFPIIEAMIFNNPNYTVQLCVFDKIPKKNEPEFWGTTTEIVIFSGKANLFFKVQSALQRTQVQSIVQDHGVHFYTSIVSFSGPISERILQTRKYIDDIDDHLLNY